MRWPSGFFSFTQPATRLKSKILDLACTNLPQKLITISELLQLASFIFYFFFFSEAKFFDLLFFFLSVFEYFDILILASCNLQTLLKSIKINIDIFIIESIFCVFFTEIIKISSKIINMHLFSLQKLLKFHLKL